MKLKTMLLVATVLSSALFSCSEETVMNGPVVVDQEDAILSVNLSIKEDATSKSDIAYETPVSNEEKLMNNYVIAIFDEAGTQRVGFTQDKLDGVKTFTVEVVAKGGNNRQVLTIANLTEAQYTACKDYTTLSQFKSLVASQESAFQSKNLIKVKLQGNVNLTPGQVNSFEIELVQLPARVDVAVNFNPEDTKAGASFDITEFAVTGINTKSDVVLTNTAIVENAQTPTNSSLSYKNEEDPIKKFSFYTYEKLTENSPVSITITGLLKENTDDPGVKKTYKYELNPVVSNDCKTVGIVHGNTYALNGLINLTTKTVTFNVTTKEWNPIEVGAEIKDVHYLFVKEHLIHMPNINSYDFEYASDLEVTYEIVSVKYTGYNTDGGKVPGGYTQGQDQYPSVNVDPNGKIMVSFKAAPVNYVPTYIVLKVKTKTDNLGETVNIIHYPTPYVEAWWNDLYQGGIPDDLYDGNSKKDNHNIFMITSIASGDFKIGDPRDSSGKTKHDAESNNLVSPKFVIASQHGVYSEVSYSKAEERCSKYVEGKYSIAGSWRVPTTAELLYVASLQNEQNSAVKGLLEGSRYWSAYNVNSQGKWVKTSSPADVTTNDISGRTNFIRCVHDVY